ncbi:Uncharacterised protein [Brucella melitensis]|nr:Uncharacterised protein [Brucella melitensis]
MQRLPVIDRLFQRFALRSTRAALDIFKRRLVGSDKTGTRAALDRHVADRHAAFHRQRANGFARIFDDIAGAACRADLANDRQNNILGGHARRQLAVNAHQHILGFFLDQRLGGEHMLHLRCADAMCKRTESAVGGSVAVTANDGHARQGEALLWPDDMHDALALVAFGIIFDAEIGGIPGQCLDLDAAFLVLDAIDAVGRRRNVMVHHGKRLFRVAHRAACHVPLKGLGLVTSCTRWRSI